MDNSPKTVSRVQTGVRIDHGILKVLKGLAVHKEMALNELIEGVLLHAFDGKPPFSEETLSVIDDLKRLYSVDLSWEDSHHLVDSEQTD